MAHILPVSLAKKATKTNPIVSSSNLTHTHIKMTIYASKTS